MFEDKKICFIGAGSVTEAMIAGLAQKKLIPLENITILNRENQQRLFQLTKKYGVISSANKQQSLSEADILILAVKPKDIAEALLNIREATHQKQLVLSVVAGVTTDYISDLLQHHGPVIRAMPNTSAMIGMSATAVAKGTYAKEEDLKIVISVLESIGTVSIVDEELLDAVTGLSGSGPAYFYYMIEAMEQAAVELGFEHHKARELLIQTLIGAGHMLLETKIDPTILREKVTSPGGTTMAGLKILEEYHFQEAIKSAIKQATKRSKELGAFYSEAYK